MINRIKQTFYLFLFMSLMMNFGLSASAVREYVNEGAGFCMQFPYDWVIEDHSPEGGINQIVGSNKGDSGHHQSVRVEHHAVAEDAMLSEYTYPTQGDLEKRPGYRFLDKGLLKLDNFPVSFTRYQYLKDGTPMEALTFVLILGRLYDSSAQLFLIHCDVLDGKMEDLQQMFQGIVASLKRTELSSETE